MREPKIQLLFLDARAVTPTAVMRSDDDGQHWQRGASMEVFDLDVDPNGPMRVVAATRDGLKEA